MKGNKPLILILTILTFATLSKQNTKCLSTLEKTLDESVILEQVQKCVKAKENHVIDSE